MSMWDPHEEYFFFKSRFYVSTACLPYFFVFITCLKNMKKKTNFIFSLL